MSRRAQENLITAALLVFFGGVIWLCQDFGPRARMIPYPLAIFGIVLTVIQIAWQNLRSTDELQVDLFSMAERSREPGPLREGAPQTKDRRPSWRRELAALGIVGLLVVLIFVTGIIPAVFLYTAGYFLLTRHYSLRASLVYTALLTAAIYLLFVVALQIQPYHGLLAPLIERFSSY